MKRAKKGKCAAAVPIVAVSELKLEGEDDWYTPKVFKIPPVRIVAALGKKGKRAFCVIEETKWERREVELFLLFEGRRQSPFHSDINNQIGQGPGGTFTRELLDQIIAVMTAARQEAERRGLFTERATPTSIQDVLAAGERSKRAS
jgi:hypothetical protein